ncbi:hypothetical protein HY357_03115 [Candidatus Roizmanbacteria bacterium]|nr:hypothetical protein [Candidatus Roizmanbacteria bacterium]
MLFNRYPSNPILQPNSNNPWESFATFNGSVIKKDNQYIMLYRAMGNEVNIDTKNLQLSVIGKAESTDGYSFSNRKIFFSPEHEWEKYGCEDPRITKIDDQYITFYTALSNYPPNYSEIRIGVALSKDLNTVQQKHLVTPFNAKAMAMFPEKINGQYTVMLTVNTDNPPTYITYAQFEKIEMIWDMNFWNEWYKDLDRYIIPLRRVNSDNMEVGAVPIKTSAGWVVIYSYIKHYFSSRIKKEFRIEAVLLDLKEPQKIIGRIHGPLLLPQESYEQMGNVQDVVFPEGALIEDNKIRIYYGAADTSCAVAEGNTNEFMQSFEVNSPGTLKCQKFPHNPLLQPIAEHSWEAKAVFNPAAFELEGKIYLIYRSTSQDNISYLGMAVSYDGLLIDERVNKPIFPIKGCEDPRITQIDNRLYMLYTAFDGKLPRLALTSITVADFLGRNWDRWENAKIISSPGLADKDGMLFPEKIDGKYIIFHRIEPNISIDYVDSLNFDNFSFLKISGTITPHNRTWDEAKVGINTPPLKTEKGWIIFYHGISKIDQHYRVGVLLLDLKDVTKVIGWTPYPILEPERIFEKRGVTNNVVFPCGYVLKNGIIYLYYGGADKVVCGATVSLNALIDYLLQSRSEKYLSYP